MVFKVAVEFGQDCLDGKLRQCVYHSSIVPLLPALLNLLVQEKVHIMVRIYCVVTVLGMLYGMVGCADKEQVYQGMYQSFSTIHETRMTEDPSYDPVQAREQNVPGYQEYKRDLEVQSDGNITHGTEKTTE